MSTEAVVGVIAFATGVVGLLTAIVARKRLVVHRHEHAGPNASESAARSETLTPPVGEHGSDSTWFTKWPPTAEIVAIRARYKNLLWQSATAEELRRLLGEYWRDEQAEWIASGREPWSESAESAYFRAAAKATDRRKAIHVIEGVQRNSY